MSDSDGKKTLGLRGGARPGNVKQSFSHGRTKSVVVETKRKRVVVPKSTVNKSAGGSTPAAASMKRPAGISDVEMERRLKAVQAARAREVEDAAKRAAAELASEEERKRRRVGDGGPRGRTPRSPRTGEEKIRRVRGPAQSR